VAERAADRRRRTLALVLCWNDCESTLETLESVRALRWPELEIAVVDNGSTDGSPDAVRRRFPEARVIVARKNLGVAGGRNLGIEEALRRPEIEYVLCLDNDVILEPELLAKMVAALEGAEDVGILGPVVYHRSDPERVWSAGKRLVFREVSSKMILPRRAAAADAPGLRRVDAVTGCCMLCRRRVFEQVGLFDPRYFLAAEDTDLCVRAAKAGLRSAVVGHARVWHTVHGSTGGGYVPPRAYCTALSTMLFLKAHGRPWHWLTTFLAAAAGLPAAWLRERRRGNARAVAMKLRGYRDGLLGRPVDPEVARHFGAWPGEAARDPLDA
jgi:hypothetical protein